MKATRRTMRNDRILTRLETALLVAAAVFLTGGFIMGAGG